MERLRTIGKMDSEALATRVAARGLEEKREG
jgi:hypothetical protein